MSQVTPMAAAADSPEQTQAEQAQAEQAQAEPTQAGPARADEATEATDGRSTRWADHRVARREELARVARRTVHRHGPDISMEEIAAAAGTSKSIVYRYFRDKAGLQSAVGELVLAQMHGRLDEAVSTAVTPRDGLRSMIDVYLEMVEGSPDVYWFVTRPVSEDASASLVGFLDAVAALIARPFVALLTGTPAGTGTPSGARLPSDGAGGLADLWASGAVGFVRGAGEWWLGHRDDPDAPTRDELTERVTAWLWAGPVTALARTRATTPTDLADEELS